MPEPATEPTVTEPEPTATQGDPADKPLGENGEKALKAERDRAAKAERANTDLQRQLDAFKQANETAIEKATREAAEASAKVADYERQLLVQRVALEKGVPAAHIHRLAGKTEAELATDADELMAALNTPGTPKPDPSQGARGTEATSADPAQAFANFLGSQMGN